jgi:Ca2+-transporting ATPase
MMDFDRRHAMRTVLLIICEDFYIRQMPVKSLHLENIKGINESEVPSLQQRFGKNIFNTEPARGVIRILKDIIIEPMFILLFVACGLYFLLGKTDEGIMMIIAMTFVGGISVYQETKSTRALEALRKFTEPKVIVLRNGEEKIIDSVNLVPGDVMLLSEGNRVPADGVILQQNDLTVNESIITGESFPAEKNAAGENILYQGSTINSGQCYARVTAISNKTVLGKLGKAVNIYYSPRTLLQSQINRFVKQLSLFGLSAFVLILFLNYLHSQNIISSLLYALTLAMAVIPEEIPVAFSSFMALGAFHMSKLGIISRQPQTIENLGAVSVICLDKTGTITKNDMEVKSVYDYGQNKLINLDETKNANTRVLCYAVLASEVNPFDSMEKAIWAAYEKYSFDLSVQNFKMIYEYPLQGRPPMMTHVYAHDEEKIAVAKGAAERIIKICRLSRHDQKKILGQIRPMTKKGFRILGIASAKHSFDQLPTEQDQFDWRFEGLISLYDPPKENIATVFKKFYDAKIKVKLLTGDFPETAVNIAEQVGMRDCKKYYTGEQIMKMDEHELKNAVSTLNIFARMFPDAKLRVIDTLKANGEIVAMTGDGVNDAPALKSAQIGIAMGENGTEIAQQAADLIITNDDLNNISTAIEQGRNIFNNFKKAIRYIISIHIPIILTLSLPLLLNWKFPNIFTPIHIIFLEIIMGPTCSIFYEREPVEKNIMLRHPRKKNERLFLNSELIISITQGLLIATGVLSLYYIYMHRGYSIEETRTIVFTTLITSNIFLTFVNRSFSETFVVTSRYKNNLVMPVLIISVLFLCSFLLIPLVRNLFELSAISLNDFLICFLAASLATGWFEVYKKIAFRKRY